LGSFQDFPCKSSHQETTLHSLVTHFQQFHASSQQVSRLSPPLSNMVVKIATQNVRSYESTIFCILSDPAPLKIRNLQGSCWIAVVNRNSAGSGDSGDTVPSNHDGANRSSTTSFTTRSGNGTSFALRQRHQLCITAASATVGFAAASVSFARAAAATLSFAKTLNF